ncbi:uncharacterized protein LOC111240723 [Vigna radiata var. radiata]|uniref:Uncharacterized protein LOC111240723 n=1 Tax=Vigna radiata var. radiata TaxID=3916 RepID=A0A3Q0ENM9_VIGRR|nr:uncharacterized protein LOC111240723 [Vigna radiata var. radiata]
MDIMHVYLGSNSIKGRRVERLGENICKLTGRRYEKKLDKTVLKLLFVHKLERLRIYIQPEDLETMVCFFDFQEIRAVPRKTQKPEMDLLVVAQVAQSESEYA